MTSPHLYDVTLKRTNMEPMEVEPIQQVYAFGNGSADQLGTGSAISECRSPTLLATFNAQKIKNMSSGVNFSAAVTGTLLIEIDN